MTSIRPAASGKSPASARSSVDLPAPFGPVTSKASPASSRKPRSAKTMRPPRSTLRAESLDLHGLKRDPG